MKTTIKTTINFEVDVDDFATCKDAYLAQLWYVIHANPVPLEDPPSLAFVDCVTCEIVRRWLNNKPSELWTKQARYVSNYQTSEDVKND